MGKTHPAKHIVDSEPSVVPELLVTSCDRRRTAANLTEKAATVLSSDLVSQMSQLSPANPPTSGAPSWNPDLVVFGQKEILQNCETLGSPLDISIIDCFIKASHMVHWYNNTCDIWAHSLISGDYGENQVEAGCRLRTVIRSNVTSRMLGRWIGLAQFGKLEAYLKFVTAKFFAVQLLQKELPPLPSILESISSLDGSTQIYPSGRWTSLFRVEKPYKMRKWRFAFAKDLYMTKNSSLPVGEEFVEQNLIKHLNILCGEPTDRLSDDTYDEVCEAIFDCATEIFGKPRDTRDHYYEDSKDENGDYIIHQASQSKPPSRLPSFGASFSGKRGEGGACGDLLRNYHDTGSLPEPAEGYLFGFAERKDLDMRCEVRTYHDPDLYREAEETWCRAAISMASEGVAAHVVPLKEAFKVRTITKGSAEIYHLARRWQKTIHSRMRKHPNCSLIGQPCNGAYLSNIFGNSRLYSYENKHGFFVSGDYESATDLLNPGLSEYAQEQISIRLGIPLQDQYVLKQCLTGHVLRYIKGQPSFKQQWGQLMGSPTSFPVLCLVNLAATLVSFRRTYGKEVMLSDLPVCVNGDDVLFWSKNQQHYETWKQITGECGLKFSLGKNYTSREFCVINSELYLYNHGAAFRGDTRGKLSPALLFIKEKALNSRLLSGGTRSSGKCDMDATLYSNADLDLISQILDVPAWKFLGQHRPSQSDLRKLYRELRSDYESGDMPEDYAKWYNTITGRQAGLLDQLEGDWVGDSRPSMRRKAIEVFNALQVSRLNGYIRVKNSLDRGHPSYYVPQSLGGLGLIPPSDHRFTTFDYLWSTTLSANPAVAHPFVKSITPKMSTVSFMESIRSEIREVQDTLEIEETLLPSEDIEMLRFNGETEQFWDLPFLAGFVDAQNTAIDPSDLEQRQFEFNQIIRKQTRLGDRKLGTLLRHQSFYLIDKGILSKEQRVLGPNGRLEWIGTVKTATPFQEKDSLHRLFRPVPRFV